MSGMVGYLGEEQAASTDVHGINRLDCRAYDPYGLRAGGEGRAQVSSVEVCNWDIGVTPEKADALQARERILTGFVLTAPLSAYHVAGLAGTAADRPMSPAGGGPVERTRC